AIAMAQAGSPEHPDISRDEIFVVGGAQIYKAALPLADRILMTEVDLEPDGDVHLDAPDPREWRAVTRGSRTSGIGGGVVIVDFRRVWAAASASARRPRGGATGGVVARCDAPRHASAAECTEPAPGEERVARSIRAGGATACTARVGGRESLDAS